MKKHYHGDFLEYSCCLTAVYLHHLQYLAVVVVGVALHKIKPVEAVAVQTRKPLINPLRKIGHPPYTGMSVAAFSPVCHNVQTDLRLAAVFSP